MVSVFVMSVLNWVIPDLPQLLQKQQSYLLWLLMHSLLCYHGAKFGRDMLNFVGCCTV